MINKVFNRNKSKNRTKRLGLYRKPTKEEIESILRNPKWCNASEEWIKEIVELFSR